jgi:hypothetical protein
MIPTGKLFWILGAMPHKYAQVVQPRGGGHHIPVILETGAHRSRQSHESGLVPKFIHRSGLVL